MAMISAYCRKFNLLIRVAGGLDFIFYCLACSLFALLLVAGAELVHAFSKDTHVFLWLFVILLALCCYRRSRQTLTANELQLQIDMDYGQRTRSPYREFTYWQDAAKDLLMRRASCELQRLGKLLLQVTGLILCCSLLFMNSGISLAQLFPMPVASRITLQVLPDGKSKLLHAEQPTTVQVQASDLVRITVHAPTLPEPPLLQLRKPNHSEFFQEVLFSRIDAGYQLTMRIDQASELLINALHYDKALALFSLTPPTVPQVEMALANKITTPHPDDKPLDLALVASSRTALARVELEISSAADEVHTELVHQVVGGNTYSLNTVYQTVLEPYVSADYAEIMLVAVATDTHEAKGRSAPITVQLVSAYGRYLHTLKTLRELKTKLDEKVDNPDGVAAKELSALITKANKQAQASPFFDVRDRNTLLTLQNELRKPKPELLMLVEQLDLFLLEHEILNHRERDRDFFVAMRRLAWANNSKKDTKQMLEKISKFINERRRIWRQRVDLLPDEQRPPNWSTVKRERPFMQALGKFRRSKDEKHLSEAVDAYQQWIDELEQHEDTVRQSIQQEVQRQVNSAQQELKVMQKRQALISKALDKAETQPQANLQEHWATLRRQQNSNIKQAKRLRSKLTQVSRLAAMRMQAATQAMQEVKTCGDKQQFICAESNSDLAGRLLHQTNNATRSRQVRPQRQSRQVAGGNYFGQSITSGKVELQSDYKVNRRYREDILEQIQNSNLLEKHPDLLDSYLRKVLR